jgi:cupin fold WbuC family metalloprotein
MKHIEIIDKNLMNEVSEQAKASPRLRMNYNFHKSLDEKCHRMLNAVEPGTEIPIHRHPTKDETFVILKGKVKVTTYNYKGVLKDYVILSQEIGQYGVNISKNVWHTIEAIESSMLFECKEGPFVPHEEEGILTVKG